MHIEVLADYTIEHRFKTDYLSYKVFPNMTYMWQNMAAVGRRPIWRWGTRYQSDFLVLFGQGLVSKWQWLNELVGTVKQKLQEIKVSAHPLTTSVVDFLCLANWLLSPEQSASTVNPTRVKPISKFNFKIVNYMFVFLYLCFIKQGVLSVFFFIFSS